MSEDVFDGSRHDWTPDCASRSIPLQGSPQTMHATQKLRQSQQEDQRLRASGEDCRDPTRSEQGIQFHVS